MDNGGKRLLHQLNINILKLYLLTSIVLIGCNDPRKDCFEKKDRDACWSVCRDDNDFRACVKPCEVGYLRSCENVCNTYYPSYYKDYQNYDINGVINACMKACNNADNDPLIDMNTVCHNLYNLTDERKDDPNVALTLCKLSNTWISSDFRAEMKDKFCPNACKAGDSEACAIIKERETDAKEREECHITKWRMYGHGGYSFHPDFYTLQNVSWQNDPITLSRPDGCITLAVDFEFYEREAELGRKINLFQDDVTNKVYDCAVSNFNSKLIEVAKKCDGRWF